MRKNDELRFKDWVLILFVFGVLIYIGYAFGKAANNPTSPPQIGTAPQPSEFAQQVPLIKNQFQRRIVCEPPQPITTKPITLPEGALVAKNINKDQIQVELEKESLLEYAKKNNEPIACTQTTNKIDPYKFSDVWTLDAKRKKETYIVENMDKPGISAWMDISEWKGEEIDCVLNETIEKSTVTNSGWNTQIMCCTKNYCYTEEQNVVQEKNCRHFISNCRTVTKDTPEDPYYKPEPRGYIITSGSKPNVIASHIRIDSNVPSKELYEAKVVCEAEPNEVYHRYRLTSPNVYAIIGDNGEEEVYGYPEADGRCTEGQVVQEEQYENVLCKRIVKTCYDKNSDGTKKTKNNPAPRIEYSQPKSNPQIISTAIIECDSEYEEC